MQSDGKDVHLNEFDIRETSCDDTLLSYVNNVANKRCAAQSDFFFTCINKARAITSDAPVFSKRGKYKNSSQCSASLWKWTLPINERGWVRKVGCIKLAATGHTKQSLFSSTSRFTKEQKITQVERNYDELNLQQQSEHYKRKTGKDGNLKQPSYTLCAFSNRRLTIKI